MSLKAETSSVRTVTQVRGSIVGKIKNRTSSCTSTGQQYHEIPVYSTTCLFQQSAFLNSPISVVKIRLFLLKAPQ